MKNFIPNADYSNAVITQLAYQGPYNNKWTWAPKGAPVLKNVPRVAKQHNRYFGMLGN